MLNRVIIEYALLSLSAAHPYPCRTLCYTCLLVLCALSLALYSPGGNALTISGYNRNVTVSRNHFAFVGDSAILSHGRGSGSMDAIHGEYPSGTRIEYNLMRELGLYVKQSGAYYAGLSPEATLIGNVAFNMPRAG